MTNQMELQVHFYGDLKEASISTRSSTSGELGQYGEILLFNCLAFRQLSNLRITPLAQKLEIFYWEVGPGISGHLIQTNMSPN